ncbi:MULTISPECIES: hypothetical protein [Paraburkholderia]|uniref:Uncharacterized protein n=1 Tax=Paraburkholderia unamae TaxID=219649 RepID=A0ACC6RHH0_9BURK
MIHFPVAHSPSRTAPDDQIARYDATVGMISAALVIVYYEGEVKFASLGMDRPELVAKWLLTDLVRRAESSRRKRPLD